MEYGGSSVRVGGVVEVGTFSFAKMFEKSRVWASNIGADGGDLFLAQFVDSKRDQHGA